VTAGTPAKAPGANWLASPAYLIALLFAADTLFVWASHLFPSHPDNALWRHMAVGALSQPLSMLVLSLLVLLGAAILTENRRLVAAVGRIGLGAAVVLLVLLVPFAIDSRTLITSLPAEQQPRFAWLITKQAGQILLSTLAFVMAAVAARRLAAHAQGAAVPAGARPSRSSP